MLLEAEAMACCLLMIEPAVAEPAIAGAPASRLSSPIAVIGTRRMAVGACDWPFSTGPLKRVHLGRGRLKTQRLLLALLAFCTALSMAVRAEPQLGASADQGLPPRPALIPPETPVADVVLVSTAPANLSREAAWPLRPGEALRLVYPLATQAEEVDPYGWRYSDSRQAWRMHAGQDLVAPQGTPVLAMLPGHVALVEELDGYGLTVVLDHGRGWQTLYAHLLKASVSPGDFLPAATPLGQVGQSGRASGPHLHVELRRRDGERMLALDPTPLIEQATRLLPQAPPPLEQAQLIPLRVP